MACIAVTGIKAPFSCGKIKSFTTTRRISHPLATFACPLMTLLLRLKDYRQLRSAVDKVPIYCVFGDTVMHSIVEKRPLSLEALSGIRGFTSEKCDRYGGDIVQLVSRESFSSLSLTQPSRLNSSGSDRARAREHKDRQQQQQQRASSSTSNNNRSSHSDGEGGGGGNSGTGGVFTWGGRRRGLRRRLLQQAIPLVATGLRTMHSPSTLKHTRGNSSLPSNGDGIYVLELAQGRVYVGRTTDWRRRLTQHMSGHGSAFTQVFPPTGTILPRLGRVTGSPEAAERDETLRYMYLRGIAAVRGWKYTRVEMSEAEQQDAEANIRELFDLCRRCGHPGHFVTRCKAHFDRHGNPCRC